MDTFHESIGERIPWLPDETLFSWCSRYHYLAVNGLASATCMQLFGRRRQGLAHDFPSGVGALADRAHGSLGTASEIIRDRTILPFYGPFRSMEIITDAEKRMAGGGIGALKFRLGLLTSGLGAAHPLKACVACMHEDRDRSRVPYWHRTHQLPSTWFCPLHSEPLLVSPLKLDQRARFQWVLPQDACLSPWWQRNGTDNVKARIQEIGMRLAEFGGAACALPPGGLANAVLLAATLRNGLASRGWTTASGRSKWQSLASDLQLHASALSALPPMAMQVDLHAAHSQLSRILAGRSLTHPLRYLAWMSLVFDSWSDFQTTLGSAANSFSKNEPTSSAAIQVVDLRPAAAVDSLRTGQESLTAVARKFDVSVATVAAWAAAAGIATPRRPKVLHESLWLTAVQLLVDGNAKAMVAERCGVSIVTITRILRSVPGLQSSWHSVRRKNARELARDTWISAVIACGILGIAAVRRIEPATYAWLYRNDRTWLEHQCALAKKCNSTGNHSDTRLMRADERYARGLKYALNAQAMRGGTNPSSIGDWLAFAPGLRRAIKSPESWPKTLQLFQTAMRTSALRDNPELF